MSVHVGDTIRELLYKNGLLQADLHRGLNKSPYYVHQLLKKASIDSAVLENVAKFFKVSITVFFEPESEKELKKGIVITQKKCKTCNEKDILIDSQKDTIESLKKLVKFLEKEKKE